MLTQEKRAEYDTLYYFRRVSGGVTSLQISTVASWLYP
jgi:hypothetical protein